MKTGAHDFNPGGGGAGSSGPPAHLPHDAAREARELRREFRSYVWGIVLALITTAIPFALVHWHVLPRSEALIATGVLALIQVICHFRFFLHVSLARQKREDLQLILFSTLLLLIMAGGTIWIMVNLAARMMGHPMG